ncbi:integral membrane protein [Stagonosporopsis vannaccii]|nr:integral membrane protein [Stagonosporopsis vannaccii]
MADVNGTLTLIPPPPGYAVNFANPQRQLETQVYTVVVVGNLLALAFLLQRLYTRFCLMRLFQIEDGAVLGAWIFSIGTQATLLVGWLRGVMGVHAWEISLNDFGLYSRLILAAPLLYALCTACAKAALCLFYGRLSPGVMFQIAVKATLVLILGAYTGIFFSLLFACRPIAASWDPLLAPIAQCVNRGAIYISTAIIGIVTDVILLCLPIPTIWKLQMPLKQKIGLTGMFIIGSITIVTSIIRLLVLLPALTTMDQTWVIGEGTLWIFIESNLLVICCCLPTLRRFLRHLAPRLIGEYTDDPSREESNGPKPRTWGSMTTRPKRQFDTLMNTVDEAADDIPLELRGDQKKLSQHETKVESRPVKGDDDSEEAILFERSVHVAYETVPSMHSHQSR